MTTIRQQHSHPHNPPSSSFALQCFTAIAVTVSALVQPVITAFLLLSAWLYQSCRSHRNPEPQVHVHQTPNSTPYWSGFFSSWPRNHPSSNYNHVHDQHHPSHNPPTQPTVTSHSNVVIAKPIGCHVSRNHHAIATSHHRQPTGPSYRDAQPW